MSSDRQEMLDEVLENFGVDILVEARVRAGKIYRDPGYGDGAFARSIRKLRGRAFPLTADCEEIRLELRRAIWKELMEKGL